MDPDVVARAFVDHYYRTFDSSRASLSNLYGRDSILNFEGQRIQGLQAIGDKLTSLPLYRCQHNINFIDCLPATAGRGILVLVTGNLKCVWLHGEIEAFNFSETFELRPTPAGGLYIHGDLFRVQA